jgi:hypothetical protein
MLRIVEVVVATDRFCDFQKTKLHETVVHLSHHIPGSGGGKLRSLESKVGRILSGGV